VIVHELLHFYVPNHGKLWKSLMRAHLGDYERGVEAQNQGRNALRSAPPVGRLMASECFRCRCRHNRHRQHCALHAGQHQAEPSPSFTPCKRHNDRRSVRGRTLPWDDKVNTRNSIRKLHGSLARA
jgi:hypothetical protein